MVSVVGQAGTAPNYNNMVYVCSVLKYLAFLGISTQFDPADAAAAEWAGRYFALPSIQPYVTVPQVVPGALGELYFRAFGPGSFPPRPAPPAQVVDMVFRPPDAPGDSDFVLSFYGHGVEVIPGVLATNIIPPLPPEMTLSYRAIVPKRAVVFLGTDPLGRGPSIAAAIDGSGFTASVVSFPVALDFWNDLLVADVLVAGAGIPHLSGTLLGIPTLIVTNTAAEDARILSIIPTGQKGWEYLGPLLSLTDAAVRTAARNLMGDADVDKARRAAMSAHGLLRQQDQGVRRIAEWIYRYKIGTVRVIHPLVSMPQWPHSSTAPDPGKV